MENVGHVLREVRCAVTANCICQPQLPSTSFKNYNNNGI